MAQVMRGEGHTQRERERKREKKKSIHKRESAFLRFGKIWQTLLAGFSDTLSFAEKLSVVADGIVE